MMSNATSSPSVKSADNYGTSHVAQHSRATTSHSYGASQNSTIRNFVLPGPIIIKLGVIDYIGDPYSYANFG